MIVTLTLNPSIDYVMQVDEITAEDTLRAKQVQLQAGGKGINVSRVLTCLGMDNQAWGFSGGCTGKWLNEFLDAAHVHHDFIELGEETRINTIITEMLTHRQIRVSAPGKPIQPQDEARLLSKIDALSPDEIGWLVMGGSVPPGIQPDIYRRIIEKANAKGISCLLDADEDSLKAGLNACPKLIKPNEYELQRLVGRPLKSVNDMVQAAQGLIQAGQTQVVVTSLGDKGAVMVTADHVLTAQAPSVEVKSKVGAGDSMVAGLVYGFCKELPLEDILKHGIAAGSAAVMTGGNELCDIPDMDKLYSQIHVEALTGVR